MQRAKRSAPPLAQIAEKLLAERWIFYPCHPQIMIVHTDKVEGCRPTPDGLIRVAGVRLK